MQTLYEHIKTPYKYGVVFKDPDGHAVDCPSVFRYGNAWYMMYVIFDGSGYETALAKSPDLLNWTPLGKILSFQSGTWDARQNAGFIALQDPQWGGSYSLQTFDHKYWLSYIGGALEGYETDPLSIGVAHTDDPSQAREWSRPPENPVLRPEDPDSRPFEQKTLYKSHILSDPDRTLGHRFVMYYNGKQRGEWIERIGMAVSDDLLHWKRYGEGPVIDNGSGISGDPQIQRIGDVWVMFYFGAHWKPDAFDTFAWSRDLVHWTLWDGPLLIQPSEPFDETYAHKPWVIFHDGVVYHFYCATGNQGRVIAVATSRDLRGQ
jgi:predicted GH43/DUF377 family glycosyl hydrolase